MYYVIKRQRDIPMTTFIGFRVPKYIASKNNENVIFEFNKNGKPIRKWVKKEDVVLLTDNEQFFNKTMEKFKDLESTQKKLVDEAQEKLNQSVETFTETMNNGLDEFSEIKNSSDIPCQLKNL